MIRIVVIDPYQQLQISSKPKLKVRQKSTLFRRVRHCLEFRIRQFELVIQLPAKALLSLEKNGNYYH